MYHVCNCKLICQTLCKLCAAMNLWCFAFLTGHQQSEILLSPTYFNQFLVHFLLNCLNFWVFCVKYLDSLKQSTNLQFLKILSTEDSKKISKRVFYTSFTCSQPLFSDNDQRLPPKRFLWMQGHWVPQRKPVNQFVFLQKALSKNTQKESKTHSDHSKVETVKNTGYFF